MEFENIVYLVKQTLIEAASTFSEDKIQAYQIAIEEEKNEKAKWIMESILENAIVANEQKGPLCDDTGIPHVMLEIGEKRQIQGDFFNAIHKGIEEGLRDLPGRPMAVQGNDMERLEQSKGLFQDPAMLQCSPILIKKSDKEDRLRLHILMQGGGPEIRAKTYRVFHKHNVDEIQKEIISWATESVKLLGCTPTTLAVGIGRSHFEASSLMIEAMATGNYLRQTEFEKNISNMVNESNVGPLGLGGKTVLGTFVKIGPQRASGVRIVCMRPCCCFEPRRAYVDL